MKRLLSSLVVLTFSTAAFGQKAAPPPIRNPARTTAMAAAALRKVGSYSAQATLVNSENPGKKITFTLDVSGEDFLFAMGAMRYIHAQGKDYISDDAGAKWRRTAHDPMFPDVIRSALRVRISIGDGAPKWEVVGQEGEGGEKLTHVRMLPPPDNAADADAAPHFWLASASDAAGGFLLSRVKAPIYLQGSLLASDIRVSNIGKANPIRPPADAGPSKVAIPPDGGSTPAEKVVNAGALSSTIGFSFKGALKKSGSKNDPIPVTGRMAADDCEITVGDAANATRHLSVSGETWSTKDIGKTWAEDNEIGDQLPGLFAPLSPTVEAQGNNPPPVYEMLGKEKVGEDLCQIVRIKPPPKAPKDAVLPQWWLMQRSADKGGWVVRKFSVPILWKDAVHIFQAELTDFGANTEFVPPPGTF